VRILRKRNLDELRHILVRLIPRGYLKILIREQVIFFLLLLSEKCGAQLGCRLFIEIWGIGTRTCDVADIPSSGRFRITAAKH
jgi:hypothetical protein